MKFPPSPSFFVYLFFAFAPVGCAGKIECCWKNVGGGSVPGSACFAFHEEESGGDDDDGLDIASSG